jgi:hypothetical protein
MLTLLDPTRRRRTLGADKDYDTPKFIAGVRALGVTPHVSPNRHRYRARSTVDALGVALDDVAIGNVGKLTRLVAISAIHRPTGPPDTERLTASTRRVAHRVGPSHIPLVAIGIRNQFLSP